MSKQFKKFLLKIILLTVFFVLILNIGDYLINANSVTYSLPTNNSNTNNFLSTENNSGLGKTGVAISTNVGIRYTQRENIPATIYKDVFSINEIITNQKSANQELIGVNMKLVEEYKNVLNTDIKQLMDSSYDKNKILDAFIEQLEYRYTIGNSAMSTLSQQKQVFLSNITSTDSKIESLKTKIESDFENNDSQESLNNINQYLDLKKQYYYSRTYIVYINHFLNEYNTLNNYNKVLLDTLINNKDAITKNAYVVLPDSGTGYMKKFNLIYTEEEYKTTGEE